MHILFIVAVIMLLGGLIGFRIGQDFSSMNKFCFEMSPLLDRLKEDALQLEKAVHAACWSHERSIMIAEALERVGTTMRTEKNRIEESIASG